MLLPESDIKHFVVQARDGDAGRVRDLLFDDLHWTVRYLDVSTSKWLLGERKLISPISVDGPDPKEKVLPVALTGRDIQDSPALDEHEPVSKQYEHAYHQYFGYHNYWVGQDIWGIGAAPAPVRPPAGPTLWEELEEEKDEIAQSHLRSMQEVRGYRIHAADDDIGKVADFVVDMDTWQIRYLVVDVRRWLPGPSVLLSPQWIAEVVWHDRSLFVEVDTESIKTAPRFTLPITDEDEIAVFQHYGRTPYWDRSLKQTMEGS